MLLENKTTRSNGSDTDNTIVKKEVGGFVRQLKSFLDKEIDLEKEAVGYLSEAAGTDGIGSLGKRNVIKELKYYLRKEIDLKKEAILYLNTTTYRRPRKVINREEYSFMKWLKVFLNKEVRLKIEGDNDPHTYVLKEVGRDYVILGFGHSLRFVQKSKITFFQKEYSTV